MVLLLVGALLFMRALETRATLDSIAAGLVVGFAIGVKPSNGLFVAAPIVAALLARNCGRCCRSGSRCYRRC